MTFLEQLRRRPRLSRSVFAVFVLACLQTAVVPCAMAVTHVVQDTAVQDNRVAVEHPAGKDMGMDTSTMDKHAAMADMPDCVYCPPEHQQSSDTDSSIHSCLYPHESRVDSGKAQQVRIDQLLAQPVFINSFVFSFLLEPVHALPPQRYLIPPLPERSLNLTHCKQLK